MLLSLIEQRQSPENPSTNLSNPEVWLNEALGAPGSASGYPVTTETAYQITAVWSAVGIISDTLAELPIQLLRKLDNDATERVGNHPTMPALRLRPNTESTALTFKSASQAHVLTRGNSYAWIERLVNGSIRLWPLIPERTRIERINGNLFAISRLDRDGGMVEARFPMFDVLHIPGLSGDGVQGMSPLSKQREMLSGALAMQDFGARFFANGANPGGMMSFPDAIDAESKEKLRQAMVDQFSGINALKTLIIDNGASYSRIGIPPEDAQFLESKQFTVEEVARMFRLPLHFLGKMGQATFNNLEQMGTHFVKFTMMPWFTRWEQELSIKLLTDEERQSGMYYKFNVDGLQRGDIKTRYLAYQSGITAGWLTRNEARQKEDLNPIDGLDEPLQPLNMATSDEVDTDTSVEDEAKANSIRALVDDEVKFVRGIRRKRYSDDKKAKLITQFYDEHQQRMEAVGLPANVALGYCQVHAEQAAQMPLGSLVIQWRETHAEELVAALTGDMTLLIGENTDET